MAGWQVLAAQKACRQKWEGSPVARVSFAPSSSAGGILLSLTGQTRLPQQVALTEGIVWGAEVKSQMKWGGGHWL